MRIMVLTLKNCCEDRMKEYIHKLPGSYKEFSKRGGCYCQLFMLWMASLQAAFVLSLVCPIIAGLSKRRTRPFLLDGAVGGVGYYP